MRWQGLSRAFNRMTAQLAAQRTELMEVNNQLDERRRFTETVLAGVSAGVIGLDGKGQHRTAEPRRFGVAANRSCCPRLARIWPMSRRNSRP